MENQTGLMRLPDYPYLQQNLHYGITFACNEATANKLETAGKEKQKATINYVLSSYGYYMPIIARSIQITVKGMPDSMAEVRVEFQAEASTAH